MMKRNLLAVLLFFTPFWLWSEFDHEHSLLNEVLGDYVLDAKVNYKGLQQNDDQLLRYLDSLDTVSRDEVHRWTREQQLAFWINGYNAFTLKAILDNYPVTTHTVKGIIAPASSILQIHGVWKELEWNIAGESLTLDQIEHQILRVEFSEPRIHFSIVCASVGCPDLRSEAFTAAKLEMQLEDQTLSYISNDYKGFKVDLENDEVSVSKLFSWFTEDFQDVDGNPRQFKGKNKKEQSILLYISQYIDDSAVIEFMASTKVDFKYLSYDWALNEWFVEEE